MNQDLTAVAKDNTVRVSPTKLSNLVKTIVNKKVGNAINQLKFSNKRVSTNVLKSPSFKFVIFPELDIVVPPGP